MIRSANFLAAAIASLSIILFVTGPAAGQVKEDSAAVAGNTGSKPPKPVMFSAGVAMLGTVDVDYEPLELEDGLSVGAVGQIPLGQHVHLGACLDYHRAKPLTSLFVYGAELSGDIPLRKSLRAQLGAGLGHGILHGVIESFDSGFGVNRLSLRIILQEPQKIGCAFELVRTNPSSDRGDAFTTLRIAVVF